eukprot:TRINITY_DN12309_c0_g1_i2.p1 TRINITY_DN12309_c0_g1~~TRINITY_DN12309_c0_g1_i2.p1  ORF type:complete len:436 (-),score=20.10 TRINITY_DN12309_c0_g1_i2:97-1404(-)
MDRGTELCPREGPSPFNNPILPSDGADAPQSNPQESKESSRCCLFDYCAEVDPDTDEGNVSTTGSANATYQDFARSRFIYGDGFWHDFLFYIKNNHSFISLFCAHRNNPFGCCTRFSSFLVAMMFALFLSAFFSVYWDCGACAATNCGQCIDVADFSSLPFNVSTRFNVLKPDPAIARWLRAGIRGGCRWCSVDSRNYDKSQPNSTSNMGSGCYDYVYPSAGWLFEHMFPGLRDPGAAPRVSPCWLDESSQIFNTSSSINNYFVNNSALSINNVQTCGLLPPNDLAFVNQTHAAYDACELYRYYHISWFNSLIGGLFVLGYTKILVWSASCLCAFRGEKRRVTVCCCRSCGWLLYFSFALQGLVYGVAALVLLLMVMRTSYYDALIQFLLSKLFSWGYEIPFLLVWFTMRYYCQRHSRVWDESLHMKQLDHVQPD